MTAAAQALAALRAAGFRGRVRRLDDIDLPKLGALIGVGEDEMHAFLDVETSGSGFDKMGRPKMLFEPHIFWRNLSGAKRDRAVRAGLAYPPPSRVAAQRCVPNQRRCLDLMTSEQRRQVADETPRSFLESVGICSTAHSTEATDA
ncbi:DUF3380 domain-containing protein [Rhodoplanes serenus]|uniref:DUF3380 domain-containing protein n=1 Tax=Rhodoplanes serenus TaxID=200615 RepID=A0A9X4XPA8_9BRAD|nr:N-acetylmuramidase domain-containing protein [Rhodoplanes serenus]MTW18852.1 DUF3380 domain-containing protein [Rhodoplanes serenus]